MDKSESIRLVIENLKSIFGQKSELRGFDDWDCYIGCIMELERIAGEIAAEKANAEAEAYQKQIEETDDAGL